MFEQTRFRPFRCWVIQQYYDNRSEYDSWGEDQPFDFAEYWQLYKRDLMMRYKHSRKKVVDNARV